MKERCAYFSFRVDTLPIVGTYQTIRVPIYQCIVADTMRTRLRSLPGGDALVNALEQTAPDGTTHCIYGPDIEHLSIVVCTPPRCQNSCLPAFVDMMSSLGLDPTLPVTSSILAEKS